MVNREVLQYYIPVRIFALIFSVSALIYYIVLVIASVAQGDYLLPILSLALFFPITKYFQSLFIYNIVFDFSGKQVLFQGSLGTVILNKDKIAQWGIRRISSIFIREPLGYGDARFFECTLKNGERFIYPLNELAVFLPRKSIKDLRNYFETAFEMHETKLETPFVKFPLIGAFHQTAGRYFLVFLLL